MVHGIFLWGFQSEITAQECILDHKCVDILDFFINLSSSVEQHEFSLAGAQAEHILLELPELVHLF